MTVAKFQEDAFGGGDGSLTVALDTTGTRVCLSGEWDDVWPPLYFTPQRAREIGRALLDAARAADGSTDPASLFAEPPVLLPVPAVIEWKAALWDALMSSQRLRVLGWAEHPERGVTHFGLEAWAQYPGYDCAADNAQAQQIITTYAATLGALPQSGEAQP